MAKYRNEKVATRWGVFDSKKEYERFLILLDAQKRGKISGLQRQVEYLLIPRQQHGKRVERAVKYVADFVYTRDGEEVVEDVKGYKKGQAYALFAIKRKLMLLKFGIEVQEV